MRLLSGIAALTILCMFAVAVVTDHLADICLSQSGVVPSGHIHLIDQVTQALKRAQDCRRAYLATGDRSYLDAYRAACADVDSSMDRLVNEDQAVTSKLTHAEDLRELVHQKLTEIGRALESGAAAKSPAAIPAADTDLARVQRLLDSLAQDESRDISGEMQAVGARAVFHRDLVIALAAINLLFLGGVAFCATQIGKLYTLITMCAWSKRVQYEDKWIPLEEYMRKRFGIRISHGISQEEYDKWASPEMAGLEPQEESLATGSHAAPASTPKAAA
jgi:CHASE3 domain sensor protein